MKDFSLKIIFRQSRSKNYHQALKLASEFDNFNKGELNTIDISMKEIFEKWEFFNLLFWRTVDWKGTVLEWEGMAFHSHTDKTRLFYALQHAHVSYICFLEAKIKQLYKVHVSELKYEDLNNVYSESDMNYLIDTFQIFQNKKEALDKTHEEYSNIQIKKRPWFLQ